MLTIKQIQRAACETYGITLHHLRSPRRAKALAQPRQVAMYACCQHTGESLPEIGRHFGGRDHTTVMHGRNRVTEALKGECWTDLERDMAMALLAKIDRLALKAKKEEPDIGSLRDELTRSTDLVDRLIANLNRVRNAAALIQDQMAVPPAEPEEGMEELKARLGQAELLAQNLKTENKALKDQLKWLPRFDSLPVKHGTLLDGRGTVRGTDMVRPG